MNFFLHILDTSSLLECDWQIFSPNRGLSFHSLSCVLLGAKDFIFNFIFILLLSTTISSIIWDV